jgi:hypothetical protein
MKTKKQLRMKYRVQENTKKNCTRGRNFSIFQNGKTDSGQPSLLFIGNRGYFPGVKWPRHDVDHLPPSNAEVNDRVELYLCSCCVSSCLDQGQLYRILSKFKIIVSESCNMFIDVNTVDAAKRSSLYPCKVFIKLSSLLCIWVCFAKLSAYFSVVVSLWRITQVGFASGVKNQL